MIFFCRLLFYRSRNISTVWELPQCLEFSSCSTSNFPKQNACKLMRKLSHPSVSFFFQHEKLNFFAHIYLMVIHQRIFVAFEILLLEKFLKSTNQISKSTDPLLDEKLVFFLVYISTIFSRMRPEVELKMMERTFCFLLLLRGTKDKENSGSLSDFVHRGFWRLVR